MEQLLETMRMRGGARGRSSRGDLALPTGHVAQLDRTSSRTRPDGTSGDGSLEEPYRYRQGIEVEGKGRGDASGQGNCILSVI